MSPLHQQDAMLAPKFWSTQNRISGVLTPLAFLWKIAAQTRQSLLTPWRSSVPVICVGNIVVGGAGKTPLAIALAKYLISQNYTPHFLTRGYGGSEYGPLYVDPQQHIAQQVGDEALMLAAVAPTWVSKNRATGAKRAIAQAADVLIMDDGFQNTSLYKNISLLAVDGGYGFGNKRVMPAGPLREGLVDGLSRADMAIVTGADETDVIHRIQSYCPAYTAFLSPQPNVAVDGKSVFAFAGIGRPEKFYATLRNIGCNVKGTKNFPDHHRFTSDQIMWICDRATELDAVPVTTEKDYVRLPDDVKSKIEFLQISLEWDDPSIPNQIVEAAGLNV